MEDCDKSGRPRQGSSRGDHNTELRSPHYRTRMGACILPITFISPINWRNIDLSVVAVSSRGLLLLSTLFTLVLDADLLRDDPPVVDLRVVKSVCTRMHEQPLLL